MLRYWPPILDVKYVSYVLIIIRKTALRLSCEVTNWKSFDIRRTYRGYIYRKLTNRKCGEEWLKILVGKLVCQFVIVDSIDEDGNCGECSFEGEVELLIGHASCAIIEYVFLSVDIGWFLDNCAWKCGLW